MPKEENQFYQILARQLQKNKRGLPKRVLCVDPGETTGYAIFQNGKLIKTDQLATKKEGLAVLDIFNQEYFSHVVIEDYKIYPHRLAEHQFSELFTVKVIGALDYMFSLRSKNHYPVKIIYQMAATPQGFVTKEKVKDWGFWTKSLPHAREAVRHGLYYLLFGKG